MQIRFPGLSAQRRQPVRPVPAALPRAAARVDQPDGHDENGDDAGFTGWLASSLELKLGLLVQTLNPEDAAWCEAFAA